MGLDQIMSIVAAISILAALAWTINKIATTEKDLGLALQEVVEKNWLLLIELLMVSIAVAVMVNSIFITAESGHKEISLGARVLQHSVIALITIIGSLVLAKHIVKVIEDFNARHVAVVILILIMVLFGPVVNLDIVASIIGKPDTLSDLFSGRLFSNWRFIDPNIKTIIWLEFFHIFCAINIGFFAHSKFIDDAKAKAAEKKETKEKLEKDPLNSEESKGGLKGYTNLISQLSEILGIEKKTIINKLIEVSKKEDGSLSSKRATLDKLLSKYKSQKDRLTSAIDSLKTAERHRKESIESQINDLKAAKKASKAAIEGWYAEL